MSNRYEHLHYCEYRDTETGLIASNYVDVMNEQDQKIKDLEHRLSKCIEPKFKVGQEVWIVDNLAEEIYVGEVEFIEAQKYKKENVIWYHVEYFDECTMSGPFEEPFTFATEEEAKAKLRSLKDGCDGT
jgi:hypothetical protein